EMRWISTEEPAMKEFKAFLDEYHKVLHKGFIFKKGACIPHETESAAERDGLNAGFVVQTLIEWFSRTSHPGDAVGKINSDLAMALKVHSYVNMAQMGHASLGDMAKVLELVRTALISEEAAQASLSTFGRALGHLISVTEGFNIVLRGFIVGLDAYELAHAENNIERSVFGTQLAFDSASLAAGLAGIGMGLVGASTAAAALGGASVILAGLVAILQTLMMPMRGGYRYDAESGYLVPLPGAVVSRVDLAAGGVDFDSQYIYRTRHGSTGSGKINYFFWAGDFPKMVSDYSQAINVRAGIGKKKHTSLAQHDSFTTLILPGTPKSYISYHWVSLPGATTRHDRGFDVIRRLEEDYRFDFDVYIFHMEEIIGKISHEYVETSVSIILDTRSIRVQIPTLPTEMQSKMSYTLQGAGGEYTIGLNTGAGLTLKTIGYRRTNTVWILDARQLANDSVEVSDDHVNGETLEVDFTNHTATPIAEDASKWHGSSEGLADHLRSLAKGYLSHGKFIVTNNYTNPITSRMAGRAFYDVDQQRMLYTDDASDSLTPMLSLEQLLATTYTSTTTSTAVYGGWKQELANVWRSITLFMRPQRARLHVFGKTVKKIVMAAYHHALGNDKDGELVYAIESEKMTIVSHLVEKVSQGLPVEVTLDLLSVLYSFKNTSCLRP
ncbi:hypothetical protein RUND412_011345, partial [Rhizina undulata]